MDIIAHGLWAGAAGAWLAGRRKDVHGSTVAAMVGLSLLPDIIPVIPVLAASVVEPEPIAFLKAYVNAEPGTEPPMPLAVRVLSDHLHCVMHSLLVLALVTAGVWLKRRAWLLPLLGWWLHVAIDIPTHSGDFYPVYLFYPVSDWVVQGVAWKTPWVFAANYVALALIYGYLLLRSRRPVPA